MRSEFRSQHASNLKAIFSPNVPLVIHFDGKLLPAISSGPTKDDRIAIVVSGLNTEKLLGVPNIEKSTGEEISQAVFSGIKMWNMCYQIVGMSFDTTASNTGRLKGACVLLEQKLEKKLLWLACRHHIFEVICGEVFKALFGPTSGPGVKIFSSFREFWPNLNRSEYEKCNDCRINNELLSFKIEAIAFASDILKKNSGQLLIEDYRELLELTLIFLGETPPRGITFRAPGAYHHARWMSKLLYVLKCYLFRSQFHLDEPQQKACLEFGIFITLIYVKAWIQCPNACDAPYNDLNLIKYFSEYSTISKIISETATAALRRHLWYLSEELAPIALFSDLVPNTTKSLMVARLNEFTMQKPVKRFVRYIGTEGLSDQTVAFFIGPASHTFFEIFKFDVTFLNEDITPWNQSKSFNEAKKYLMALKVVNDSAERAIALATNFNHSLTTNESEKQHLLQVVESDRKNFPNCNKSTLFQNI